MRHDRVAKSLAAGDLSSAHAEVLANATQGRTALLERDVDTLIDIAPTLSVDDYTTAMKHWRAAADDAMARDDAHLAFHERSVSWVSTLDGRFELRASLDAEGGATVVRALEAYDRPDRAPGEGNPGEGSPGESSPAEGGPVEGPRSVAQRLADGLVQLCSESLHERERAGHHTPGVDGLIDVARLASASVGHGAGAPVGSALAEAADALGSSAGPLAEWLRSRCELRGVGPVARDTMLRLACDGAVGRVVMRGESEVLDLGRRTRVVSRGLRRTIELRDRGCAFPGCEAPLHWCDAHHLVHWADGGVTSLDNCVLLCRRHHVLCHEGGWELARGPDGRFVIAVRGRRPRARRRGPPARYDLAA